MKKKHFIFLGTAGIIYYSWLFIILFISLILMYESNTTINWPAII
ncbi:MAG: EbsA family protein, partial [Lactobacillus sp.]|nr:EbsA family protein [Lactobacillus sp.]